MAEKPDDLAGVEIDAGVIDGLDAAEGNRNVAHFDKRLAALSTQIDHGGCGRRGRCRIATSFRHGGVWG
jgi:hypothetical protein